MTNFLFESELILVCFNWCNRTVPKWVGRQSDSVTLWMGLISYSSTIAELIWDCLSIMRSRKTDDQLYILTHFQSGNIL